MLGCECMKKTLTGVLLGCLLLAGNVALAAEPVSAVKETGNGKEPATEASLPETPAVKSKGTMVFVPLDTRPVCKDDTVATMRAAGWNILVPPEEMLSSAAHSGEPDRLIEWLEEN